jgi:signal transduction histidine kinase/CheY-like chemotaxis protein
VYVVTIPLIWMALSIGPRGVTLALFTMTVFSISGVLFGYSGPGELPVGDQLIQTEVFDGIITIIFLIFVSSEEGRKLASRALKEHITQLESALHRISSEDRAKNEFLAILAHELRNPLAPILSSLELMRVPHTDKREVEHLLNTMDDRVHTMARLLDDLLDISRISQKKFKLQKETVDLNLVLERSAETASVLMQSKNHTLTVKLLEKPTWISGDPVRLEQIVINLLNNAAKYSEPGGTICLSAAQREDSVSICIKDAGVGIPRDMLGRIFEPFLQVEQARRSEGLGIGLSLAKRLVEMHHGTIEARSEGLGRGSEFIVHLPVPPVVQLPIPVARQVKRAHAAPIRPLRIFVVDDNKLAAEGLGKLLTYKGHSVTLAFDAQEALAVAPELQPDAIILDIGLPDRDGYYVARQLKEVGLDSFFIALTGYGQDKDKLKARQAGFDYHLTKPVSITDVEVALSNAQVMRKKMIAS